MAARIHKVGDITSAGVSGWKWERSHQHLLADGRGWWLWEFTARLWSRQGWMYVSSCCYSVLLTGHLYSRIKPCSEPLAQLFVSQHFCELIGHVGTSHPHVRYERPLTTLRCKLSTLSATTLPTTRANKYKISGREAGSNTNPDVTSIIPIMKTHYEPNDHLSKHCNNTIATLSQHYRNMENRAALFT